MARLAVLLIVGLTTLASKASACSCGSPRSAADAAARSRVVFAGRVTAMERARAPVGDMLAWRATIRVERRWKGQPDTVAVVWTTDFSVLCGFPFHPEVTYLVYAVGKTDRELSTHVCSRTARLSDALADAAALGAGEPVPRPIPPPAYMQGSPRFPPQRARSKDITSP